MGKRLLAIEKNCNKGCFWCWTLFFIGHFGCFTNKVGYKVSHIDHVSARSHVFLRGWMLDS